MENYRILNDMKIEYLISELNRLYDEYEVDKSQMNLLTQEQIVSQVKGILAVLDKKKKHYYKVNDFDVIKDIYHYYC